MLDRFELFITSISQIYKCVQKIKSREMTELGLKGPQVMYLLKLRRVGELTSSELASLCMEDKAAVSRTMARLENEGLVIFDESGNKRRYRSKIRLTPKGEELADKMTMLIESAVEKGGEGLSDPDRDAFYRSLSVIAENLRKICENKGEEQ